MQTVSIRRVWQVPNLYFRGCVLGVGVESPFHRAMAQSANRDRLAASALLAWVAASDGVVTHNKHKALREFSSTWHDASELDLSLEVARVLKTDDLLLACEVVKRLPYEGRQSFMECAVAVALADKRLPVATNHVLRFCGRLTDIDLQEVYQKVTGRRLPGPGDPSSIEWWKQREASAKSRDRGRAGKGAPKVSPEELRADALATLGLEVDATEGEIAEAFRKLANVHHPDRFAQSSAQVRQAAAKQFARIRAAFESLNGK